MDSQMRQKPLSAVSKEDALIKTATPDKPGVEPCHPLSLNGSRLLGDEMAAEMEEEGGGRDAGRRPFSITTRTEMGPAVSLVEQMLSQVSLSSFDPVRFCSSLLSQPSSPGAPESSQVQPVQETRFFPSSPTVLLGLSTTPHREAASAQMKQPVWTNQREDRKGFFCLIPSI